MGTRQRHRRGEEVMNPYDDRGKSLIFKPGDAWGEHTEVQVLKDTIDESDVPGLLYAIEEAISLEDLISLTHQLVRRHAPRISAQALHTLATAGTLLESQDAE